MKMMDMEELLSKIESPEDKDFMQEALMCYMTGAYRGCIVLSFIALFEYVFQQLEELRNLNNDVKTIYDDINKRRQNQKVYENAMLEQIKSKKLINSLDSDFMDMLIKLRNKSAHPSSHKPSAEEARYVYSEVITRFLSKKILSSSILVDSIIDRLGNKFFFADVDVGKISQTVELEIADLHEQSYNALINKVTNIIDENGDDDTLRKNANFFINGFFFLKTRDVKANTLLCSLIVKKCDNELWKNIVLELISINSNVINSLDTVSIERVRKVILDSIESTTITESDKILKHPVNVIRNISLVYNEDEFICKFENILNEIFKKFDRSIMLSGIFNNKPKVFNLYFKIILVDAGSYDFSTSNRFCENIREYVALLSKSPINDKQAFEFMVAIANAARNGAFKATSIKDNRFNSLGEIKQKAIAYLKGSKVESTEYLKKEIYEDYDEFIKQLGIEIE